MPIEADEDSETEEEQLQRALAMSMQDDNDDEAIDCFQREDSAEVRLFWLLLVFLC
jgi:hypothetical protein